MADNAKNGQMSVYVAQDTIQTGDEEDLVNLKGTKRGELCIIDFWTEMSLEGNAFQVRMGTLTAPIAGDIVMQSTAAECAITAKAGMTFIPAEGWVSTDVDGTTNATEITFKSVSTAHTESSGDEFVPLNLFMGGIPSRLSVETQLAGGVTVAADSDTTTRQHYHLSREFTKDTDNAWQAKNMLRPHTGRSRDLSWRINPAIWRPAVPPVLVGTACLYMTVSGAGASPTYFAHIDWVEMATDNIA